MRKKEYSFVELGELNDLYLYFKDNNLGEGEDKKTRAKKRENNEKKKPGTESGFVQLLFPGHSVLIYPSETLGRPGQFQKYLVDNFRKKCSSYIMNENRRISEEELEYIGLSQGIEKLIEANTVNTVKDLRKVVIKQFFRECYDKEQKQKKENNGQEYDNSETSTGNSVIDGLQIELKKIVEKVKRRDPSLTSLCRILKDYIEKTNYKISKLPQFQQLELLTDELYYFIHFMVTTHLHTDMLMESYERLDTDLQEFNNCITYTSGLYNYLGAKTIFALADRKNPNIIATYAIGNMAYYGTGVFSESRWQLAYNYFCKAINCHQEHPLAIWSIASMMYRYSEERAGKDPFHFKVIEFEEHIKKERNIWYDKIIELLEKSYNYGCSAAANMIGEILEENRTDFPMNLFKKVFPKSSLEYYKEAADGGYAPACNNFVSSIIVSPQEGICYDSIGKEELKYIKKSVDLGDTWAKGLLALYYYEEGRKKTCKEKELYFSKSKELLESSMVLSYFENDYWALINLMKLFILDEDSNFYLETSLEEAEVLLREAHENVTERFQFFEIQHLIEKIEKIKKK